MYNNVLTKLTKKDEQGYDSYVMDMTIYDFIENSSSSNIQRMRNEKKEIEISKFIDAHLKDEIVPYIQPVILHYRGDIETGKTGGNYIQALPTFKYYITDNEGKLIERRCAFEVIDGNGRLGAFKELLNTYNFYINNAKKQLNEDDLTANQKRTRRNNIIQMENRKNLLLKTKITVQLYNDLTEEQKHKLFISVNQGESMSQGRLLVYGDKEENKVLKNYIEHTQSNEDFKYIITADKDTIRNKKDKEKYIPAKSILPVIRKFKGYCKYKEMDHDEKILFELLDTYIMYASNPPHLRKEWLSILGTVIDKAKKTDDNLIELTCKLLEFDYSKYDDVSKQLKVVRQDAVKFVFEGDK